MTAAELVAAFSLPGSEAEQRFREVVEGRETARVERAELVAFGRTLQERLGWDPELVEEAVAQILRRCALAEPR